VTSGFLIVDKPSGVTSFSMVAMVRRLTGVRRVGHAGTLDPLATGLLPIAIGQATRLIEYTDEEPKTYDARVRFGTATDTYDAEGAVTSTGDASKLTAAELEAALSHFVGEIQQTPPAYSAIKLAGKPLYRYAREGAAVSPQPRSVRIDRLELLAFDAGPAAEAEVRVTCGKGTYVRSLAHDLGQRLGCGAHLSALRRTASAGFTIDDAHTPDIIAGAASGARLDELILAPDRALERRPAMIIDDAHSADVIAGRDFITTATRPVEWCRAYDITGQFVGVLRNTGDERWHPEKVFAGA
jgi:tRNA pseudouridine55 synthase